MISRRIPRAILATIVAGAFAALTATSALAQTSGNCSVSIAGRNVASQGTGALSKAIAVPKDLTVPVAIRSGGGSLGSLRIQIELVGHLWTVKRGVFPGRALAYSVDLSRYTKYGVGLYKLVVSSGGASCSGSALVRVKGNPLNSVAGIAGLIVALAGLLGVLGAAGLAAHSGRLGIGKLLLGLLAGLLGGLGAAVLLQQYGLVYPTRNAAIGFLAGGAVASIVLSAIGRLLGSGKSRAI